MKNEKKVWRLRVWLRDGARVDQARLSQTVQGLAFGTHRPSGRQYLALDTEATTFDAARAAATELVSDLLEQNAIERVCSDDEGMENRQVLLWARAIRRGLDRWESAVASEVLHGFNKTESPAGLVWDIQIERHLLLICFNNLLRALVFATGRFSPMNAGMASNLRNLRDLNEHWDEQWPTFYCPEQPGPIRRGAVDFVERHPGRSPFFNSWNSQDGPVLGPGLSIADLHDYLDRLEAEVAEAAPELRAYVLEPSQSPWTSDPHAGAYWPRVV